MRRLNNTVLTISGVATIIFLLAASGLILLEIGSDTSGTWTSLAGNAVKVSTYGWPQPTAVIESIARGRYGSSNYNYTFILDSSNAHVFPQVDVICL